MHRDAKERNEKKNVGEGLLCAPQGPRGGIFFFPISSFSTLRRSRYIYIYIYTRQQGRGPKVKDQSFLLFIRGVGPGLRNTATIHFSFRLSLPLSFPHAFVVIVFSFPSLFLFLPFLTVPAIPNPFPCSMYYLWPYHLSLPLRFSIGFCLKELVLAHFARNPFFL